MRNKNICMLLHEYMPQDNRPRREAKALVDNGYNVDIICLNDGKQDKFELIDGIKIYRLSVSRNKSGGKISYAFEYLKFFVYSFFKLVSLNHKKEYSFIHVHNPPDILMFLTIPFFRAKKILDVHDPNPEIFMSRFEVDEKHWLSRFWILIEKIVLKMSDKVIATNKVDWDLLKNRGKLNDERFCMVMNIPDPDIYKSPKVSKENLGLDGKYIILYQGALMKRRGLQTLINAFPKIKKNIPNACLVIAGNGPYTENLKKLSEGKDVIFTGRVDVSKLAEYTQIADVCVIPFLKYPVNERGVPNKLFEYMHFHKPMIVSDLRGMRSVVSSDDVWFYSPGNVNEFTKRVLDIYNLGIETKDYSKFKDFNWEKMKENLYRCYSDVS